MRGRTGPESDAVVGDVFCKSAISNMRQLGACSPLRVALLPLSMHPCSKTTLSLLSHRRRAGDRCAPVAYSGRLPRADAPPRPMLLKSCRQTLLRRPTAAPSPIRGVRGRLFVVFSPVPRASPPIFELRLLFRSQMSQMLDMLLSRFHRPSSRSESIAPITGAVTLLG
jgi:hypothetical protein